MPREITIIYGNSDRLELRYVDVKVSYDSSGTPTKTRTPVDLDSVVSGSTELRFSIDGVDQAPIEMTPDPDQVARTGWSFYDPSPTEIPVGRLLGRLYWEDGRGPHRTEEFRGMVVGSDA